MVAGAVRRAGARLDAQGRQDRGGRPRRQPRPRPRAGRDARSSRRIGIMTALRPTPNYGPLKERLAGGGTVVLGGGIGTEILRRDVTGADHHPLERRAVARAIPPDYVEAGADVISTNTFQLTRRALYNHFRDEAHRKQVGP